MTTEELKLKVSVDVTDVKKDLNSIKTEFHKATHSVGAGGKSTDNFTNSLNKAKQESANLKNILNSLRSVNIFDVFAESLGSLASNRGMKEVAKEISNIKSELESYNNIISKTSKHLDDLNEEYKDMETFLQDIQNTSSDLYGDNGLFNIGDNLDTKGENSPAAYLDFTNKEMKANRKEADATSKKLDIYKNKQKDLNKQVAEGEKAVGGMTGALSALGPVGIAVAAALALIVIKIKIVKKEIELLTRFLKEMKEVAMDVAKVSREATKVGFNPEGYEAWGYAMKILGGTTDQLIQGVRMLTQKQVALRQGSAEAADAFKQLGIAQEDAANMGQQELFETVIKKLQNVEDKTKRTEIAFRLFGEQATNLQNILNLSNGEMNSLLNNYSALNGISPELSSSSIQLQQSVIQLQTAWLGFKRAIAEVVIPVLLPLLKFLTKMIIIFTTFIKGLFGIGDASAAMSGAIGGATQKNKGYTKSIKEATGAAKEFQRVTLGFDELNVVNDPNKGAGGLGLSIPEIEVPSIEDLGLGDFQADLDDWISENQQKIENIGNILGFLIFTVATVVCLLTGNLPGAVLFGTLAGRSLAKMISDDTFGEIFSDANQSLNQQSGLKSKIWLVVYTVGALICLLTGNLIGAVFFASKAKTKLDELKNSNESNTIAGEISEIERDMDNETPKVKEKVKGILFVVGALICLLTGNLVGAVGFAALAFINIKQVKEKGTGIEEAKNGFSKETNDTGFKDKIKGVACLIAAIFCLLHGNIIGAIGFGITGGLALSEANSGNKIDNETSPFKKKMQEIKDWFEDHICVVFTKDYWKEKWEGVKQGFKDGINGGIISPVEKAANWIVSKLNKLSFTVPDWVPGIGGNKFGFHLSRIEIPRLATGGIVTNSTLANIGENGAEAVLPLEKNTGWMDILADKLSDRNPTTLVLQVGENELGRATIKSINNITKQTGQLQLTLA